jgi:predicted NBD/HSP70 family sugar kinase
MRMSDQAFNRLSVLKKLRAAEPISRTDLARLAGLNGGTITTIIRDLVERGLVREERVPSPNRGRPKVNLRIDPEGAFVAGATLTDDGRILIEIVDLRGSCVASHQATVAVTTRLEHLAQQFSAALAEAIEASPIPRENISQIGIGLPAIVDSPAGVVAFFETFEDVPYPFAGVVEGALQIPTKIDNNINMIARSEHWFGDGTGVDDFTLVLLDLGVGGARYQSGQLLIGSHGIEAEFGHTKIVPEGGRPCHCGANGCLQTYASISGIVEQACALSSAAVPHFSQLRTYFAELAKRARAGETPILELLDRAGSYLGRGLANHINMQDPERILVVTGDLQLRALISAPFFEALHRDTLPVLRDLARVTFKELDETTYARGAAAMVLEQLYLTP